MTAAGYGAMRASDEDRRRVQTVLAEAYGEGRLNWEEMDARSTALVTAVTYADLDRLTVDLPGPHHQQRLPRPYGSYRQPPQLEEGTKRAGVILGYVGIAIFVLLMLMLFALSFAATVPGHSH
jgi:hypothetical protein